MVEGMDVVGVDGGQSNSRSFVVVDLAKVGTTIWWWYLSKKSKATNKQGRCVRCDSVRWDRTAPVF